ncbi:MAG TPA: exodeoxyribonuclease VII small subunit [Gemmatimonadetes bacterium]|jgi:exodeoxyribonuclease VII small subunit|nr:exodeoxyribonuclease VII small subunit [Gemmatimonadota bacterium]HIA73471.1 exodeoxyribonuclease VII small subunit [Gemmatimonadota bacterium]HIB08721.1 exodeoxyribonuclease VII small subunit [Gemmatimonadota bacterium]HIN78526.1 exodeoxyribonuclease VII small subunit [Gemmatimonadota bacterium]
MSETEQNSQEVDESKVEAPSLEERLRRLEEILSRLEQDDVALEEALELFEEGVGHVRDAERLLAETELRVQELLGSGDVEVMGLD